MLGVRDPLLVDRELEAVDAAAEVDREMQRQDKGEQRDDQCEDADVAVAPRQQHKHQRARQRGEGHEGENDGAEFRHVSSGLRPIQIMKAITAAEPTAIHPA